jgi:hypothetical protein
MSLHQILTRLNHKDTPILPKFSTLSKIVLFTVISITSFIFVTHALAADSSLKQFVEGKKAGNNLENWLGIDSQSINIHGLLNIAIDVDTISPDLVDGRMPRDGRFFTSAPGGLIGATNGLIASLYNPPASGVEYLAMVKDNFLGKPAYAQGIGFQGIQPILPIWRAFRNIVYLFSSLIFISIGIMIMLRVKISPQAVISIQNAIPQLVTTLILVTFSYAIIGLLIDLSYLITGVVLAVLFQVQGRSLGENLFLPGLFNNVPILGSIVNAFSFSKLSNAGMIQVGQLLLVPSFVTVMLGGIISWLVGFMIALPLGGVGGPVVGLFTGQLFGSVGAILLALILLVLIVVWLFKFLIGLFKCYATLLFKIILAPLEIGFGAFPNSKIGFNSWLMDTVANLAVFPISVLFLVISNMIIANIIWGGFSGSLAELQKGNLLGGGMWTPALLGGDLAQFGLRSYGGIAAMAVGVSTLLILSKLPEMIPQFIFMLKPSEWGKAIGESTNEITGAPMRLLGTAGNVSKAVSSVASTYQQLRTTTTANKAAKPASPSTTADERSQRAWEQLNNPPE